MKHKTLHLVRTAQDAACVPGNAVRPHEQVQCIDEMEPRQLLEQIFAHDTTVLW